MLMKWVSVLLVSAMMINYGSPALAQAPPSEKDQPTSSTETQPIPATEPTKNEVPAQPPEKQPVPAETQPAPATEPTMLNVNDCIERGKTDGRHASTGGSFFGGFVGGLFLGLIGAGIAYAVQGEPDPPTTSKYNIGGDAQCRMAYSDAYGEEGKKKKRNAALELGGVRETGPGGAIHRGLRAIWAWG